MFCGSGNDAINVGSQSPAAGGILDFIGAPLGVFGGSGADVLNVDDSEASPIAREHLARTIFW